MADGLSRVQQIGQALGGFGAGIQGNLPQFQAAQSQRRELEAAETERQRVAQLARQEQIGKFTAGAAQQALELIEAGDYDQALQLGESVITQFSQLGLDPTDAQRISALLTAAGNGSDEAKSLVISELKTQVRLGESFGFIDPPEAASPAGKLEEDFSAGLITREQADAGIARLGQAAARGQISGTVQVQDADGNLFNSATVFDPNTNTTKQVLTPLGGGPDEPVGLVELVNASGLTPTEQIEHAGLSAATSRATVIAVEQSRDAFQQLAGIESEVATLDDALVLLDEEGVDTGPILNRLPTFRSAAVQLENIQSRLGLNVIQNTTFGSLSEAELRFALDTALPTGLQPAELKAWIIRKQNAQRKLATHIAEASIFLGTPGNTIADWLKFQEQKQVIDEGSRARTGNSTTFERVPTNEPEGSRAVGENGIDIIVRNGHWELL
jgi:DNA-binding XRE family transcriptional regulator